MIDVTARHAVQFYGNNDRSLVASVGRYLAEGLSQGDGIILIAAPSRIEQLVRRLTLQVRHEGPARTGQLLCLDVQTTLARIMVDGRSVRDRFERVIRDAMDEVQHRTGHAKLRLYGEMVDMLWRAGQPAAAMRLEEYWNILLATSADCRLLCAYGIDILSHDFRPAMVAPILCTHTRVLPVAEGLALAVESAVEEILGTGVDQSERYGGQPGWAVLPKTVTTMLWLQDKHPGDADRVLRRARYYYYELE